MVNEDYLHCSAYEGHALHPTEANFTAFLHEESKLNFFALLDADGAVLLKSEGYPQEASRENGIQSVIKNRSNRDFYSVKELEGEYYLSLRAANYREIARTCRHKTEAEALALLPFVTGQQIRKKVVTETVAVATTTATHTNDRREDDYLACHFYENQPSVNHEDGMVKFTHTNEEHYFAWYDENNQLLMRSEGYPSTAARDNGYASVLKNRDLEERYAIEEKMGYYFAYLKAGNHQEIARGCGKKTYEEAAALYPSARAEAKRKATIVVATPIVEAPKVSVPIIEVPKVSVPTPTVEIPKISVPIVEAPKLEVPVIAAAVVASIPHVELPKVEIPHVEVPHIELPKVEVPHIEVPHVEVPVVAATIAAVAATVPHIELPKVEVPHVEVPVVAATVAAVAATIPHIELPKVEVPHVELPKLEAPHVEVPHLELPKVEVPHVSIPAVALAGAAVAAAIPHVEIPKVEIPKVEIPKVEIPKVTVEVPKVEVPKIVVEAPKVEVKKVVAAAAVTAAAVAVTHIPHKKEEVKKVVTPVAPIVETPIVEEKSWLSKYWWLPLLLLLGLGFLLLRGCNSDTTTATVTPPIPVETPKPVVSEAPKVAEVPKVVAPSCDLHWIYFDYNKSDLRAESKKELDHLADLLKENKGSVAVLKGFTDSKGDVAYNDALSKRRANAARAYLTGSKKISDAQIKEDASGKSAPVAKNTDDDSGRKYNRRVELYIQDATGKNICQSIELTIPTTLKE